YASLSRRLAELQTDRMVDVKLKRDHFPWADAEYQACYEMVHAGYTTSAIGARLGRSAKAVHFQIKKAGLSTRRLGRARLVTSRLRPEAFEKIEAIAGARGMTPMVLCRVVLEMAANYPSRIDKL